VFSGGPVDDFVERLMHTASGLFLLSSLPENAIGAGTTFRPDRTTSAPPATARASIRPRPFGTNCVAPPANPPKIRDPIRADGAPRSGKRLVRGNLGASRHAPHLCPDTVRRGPDRLRRGQPASHGSISRHCADCSPPCRPLTARYAALPFARSRDSRARLQSMAHSPVLSYPTEELLPHYVGG
jgi:hypothetical protein